MERTELYKVVEQKIAEIEAELKRLKRWTNGELAPEKFENMGAFGINTMTIEQWIQFVLIPRVREIIAEQGDFPADSQVGTYAMRNLDGDDEAGQLVTLLCEFDSLFG
ncbi:YqcC family protein [Candidatus Peregrinibacteria bacterium]|nr:YqcC family protein [Candidatus Peregrinibacteria bacterium]